jgi:hypothetical protein
VPKYGCLVWVPGTGERRSKIAAIVSVERRSQKLNGKRARMTGQQQGEVYF